MFNLVVLQNICCVIDLLVDLYVLLLNKIEHFLSLLIVDFGYHAYTNNILALVCKFEIPKIRHVVLAWMVKPNKGQACQQCFFFF